MEYLNMRVSDTSSFIEKSKKLYGSKYRYDRTVYYKSNLKVKITCPEHGDFEQKASNHLLRIEGCRGCTVYRDVVPFKDFVKRAKEVHGDKYSYDESSYNGLVSDVIVICPVHGEFKVVATAHLKSLGCKKCYNLSRSISKDNFIERVKIIHGNKYSYEKTEYAGMRGIIIITCPIHGDFTQIAANHSKGHGCKKCQYFKKDKKEKTHE